MMKVHQVNNLNNFIMGWYSEDTSFCDELIEWHNKNPENVNSTGRYGDGTIDNTIKQSVDSSYRPDTLEWLKYGSVLNECLQLYRDKYEYSAVEHSKMLQPFNVQWYPIGGGYKIWHYERCSPEHPVVSRNLVFLTYLNDLEDGGTDFYYQGLTVKAEKGLTLVWPADWTFTHKSQISNTSEKYIATGWVNLS